MCEWLRMPLPPSGHSGDPCSQSPLVLDPQTQTHFPPSSHQTQGSLDRYVDHRDTTGLAYGPTQLLHEANH